MPDKQTKVGRGITEAAVTVAETSIPQLLAAAQSHSWESYFPSPDWLQEQLTWARGQDDPDMFLEMHGAGWFIERMIFVREALAQSIERQDSVWAAIYAGELGKLTVESQMKIGVERFALSGQKVAAGGQASRRGAMTASERADEVDRLAAEYGKGGKDAAFVQVAEREGVSRKAIEKDYYRLRRKMRPTARE